MRLFQMTRGRLYRVTCPGDDIEFIGIYLRRLSGFVEPAKPYAYYAKYMFRPVAVNFSDPRVGRTLDEHNFDVREIQPEDLILHVNLKSKTPLFSEILKTGKLP